MVQALASHARLNEFGDEFLDAVFHWLCVYYHHHEEGGRDIRQEQVAKALLEMPTGGWWCGLCACATPNYEK